MSAKSSALLVFIGLVIAHCARAQTSLYIPGFDPQPISAQELGVGADGETTWLIAPGVTSGTFDDIGFAGTATLVEGPTTAEISFEDPFEGYHVDQKCAISGGIADCVAIIVQSGVTSTYLATETASPFEIQGGTLAPGSGSPGPATPTPTPSSESSPAVGPSQIPGPSASGGNSTSPPAPANTNGSDVLRSANGAILGFIVMASMLSFL